MKKVKTNRVKAQAPTPSKASHLRPIAVEEGGGDTALYKIADIEGDVRLLAVRYDGNCFCTDPIQASTLKYKELWKVKVGDLVLSNINAVHGAIGVVPSDLDGCFVSSEYTVLRTKDEVDPYLLQLILRTPVCRADLLLNASGIGRHRVTVAGASRTRLPFPEGAVETSIKAKLVQARHLEQQASALYREAEEEVTSALALDTPHAREVLRAFKPPK